MLLITGGAGFIGSHFVLDWLTEIGEPVVNLDKLTYAGNLRNLASLQNDARHTFVHGDICDGELIARLLAQYKPRALVHFAAESHVDRSIHGPEAFIQTNVVGTLSLLQAAKNYWETLPASEKAAFRFLHISTDEVFGSLGPQDPAFCETTPYAPNSPYSASKAGSDHLVRAFHHTYGLPTLTTNCSNNYGPYQFPEKLIPLMILHAMEGKSLPIYGDGKNIRDWLYVGDHCRALRQILAKGELGASYAIGGCNEHSNLEVVQTICTILDELRSNDPVVPHHKLISFVKDRPGHDQRYAINASKLQRELGWQPQETFASGLRKTIKWYLANQEWIHSVQSGAYQTWVHEHYGVST